MRSEILHIVKIIQLMFIPYPNEAKLFIFKIEVLFTKQLPQ